MDLLDLLISKQIITAENKAAFIEESTKLNVSILDILLKHGISSDVVLKAQSEKYGIPTKSLSANEPAEKKARLHTRKTRARKLQWLLDLYDTIRRKGGIR